MKGYSSIPGANNLNAEDVLEGRTMQKSRHIGVAVSCALMISTTVAYGGDSIRHLTVQDAFETTRFMIADSHGKSIALSPNGDEYAAMLIRGDIGRDGVEAEIVAGSTQSLDEAKPRSVARLFTRGHGAAMHGNGSAAELLVPITNFPIWIDNDRVAFLWEDRDGIRQVVAANVRKMGVEFLTDSETDVTTFAVGGESTIIYEAKKEYDFTSSDQLWRDGFTVKSPQAYDLVIGISDGSSIRDLAWGLGERFVRSGSTRNEVARKLRVTGGGINTYLLSWPSVRASVSASGRTAIVSGTPQSIPQYWAQYEGKMLRAYVGDWENRKYSISRHLQQMFVVDVDSATARPLWDAPLDPTQFASVEWSPDSRSAIVWPVYLPVDGQGQLDPAGNAVAEIDVVSGSFVVLPISREDAVTIESLKWTESGDVEVRLKGRSSTFRKTAKGWVATELTESRHSMEGVRLEVRQGPNDPPLLFGIENRSGEERLLLDPNPRLKAEIDLGEVRFVKWKDLSGSEWEGRLFLPVGYQSSMRYPLVIQTHSWGRREDFTLYGQGSPRPTLGPSSSVYLAQPLASKGIAVLQVGPSPAGGDKADGFSQEPRLRMRGFEAAVEHLYSIGIADRSRIGIMGHSRSGWHVEYALAFGSFQFAAAIVDDNIDSGYFEAGFLGWVDPEKRNGGPPFGTGMKDWLENSPTFSVEHIRSPLLMMVTDSFAGKAAPVVMQWEMFSRLRYLEKPVELYVIPNIERGSHNLQNPTQLLAQQERAMDWWLYWLKDERDPSEAKREQYVGWDRLRELRDEDAKRPKPPRLKWTVQPVAAKAAPVH